MKILSPYLTFNQVLIDTFKSVHALSSPARFEEAGFIRRGRFRAHFLVIPAMMIAVLMSGCTSMNPKVTVPSLSRSFSPGTILSAADMGPTSIERMMEDLTSVRVVYVGESHTNSHHHDIQLTILKRLYETYPEKLAVGMEMFAHPYQKVLDDWKDGVFDQKGFIQTVHWYATWKYDYDLYADLLSFIRENRIPLYGLNVPFHIPPKIAAGGIDSLLPEDRMHLPEFIDTSNAAHRAYVREVFDQHGFAKQHYDFENFYQAQCVWEDAMAEKISRHLNDRIMIVFAGNGHIQHDYGIPERAFSRSQAPYRTVMPLSTGQEGDLAAADFLWITPKDKSSFH